MAKTLKESDLIELGFRKIKVSKKESGTNAYYYYVKEFNRGWNIDLISSDSDCGEWVVQIFESTLKPFNKSQLKRYIKLIEELC